MLPTSMNFTTISLAVFKISSSVLDPILFPFGFSAMLPVRQEVPIHIPNHCLIRNPLLDTLILYFILVVLFLKKNSGR